MLADSCGASGCKERRLALLRMAGKGLLVFEGQARRRAQLGCFASTPCPTPCWARMQGHYPGNRGVRPLGVCGSEHRDAPSARLFLCADCRAQAVDLQLLRSRPNLLRRRLRAASAAPQADAAGRRYQTSRPGRLAHAERARRYRARCNKVTHQGSPPPPSDDFLSPGSLAIASDAASSDDRPRRAASHCHWCGRRLPGSRPPWVSAPPLPSSRSAETRPDRTRTW